LKGKTGRENGRRIKPFIFLHSKTFTPTPVKLEIKIKEVLNTYATDCGGRSQLGLTHQFRLSKKQGKDFFL